MIEILDYQPETNGSYLGKVSIKMHKWGGFILKGIAMMKKDDKRWIKPPHQKIELGSEIKWVPIYFFESSELQKRFSEEVWRAFDEWKK